MMLQSLADGSCLTDAPLRFEISCATHWSNATATELRLGKYILRFDGAVRSAAGRRLWLREPKLCADPWCLRCVGRTHGNRATLRPCVLGFEQLRPATVLAAAVAPAGAATTVAVVGWALFAVVLVTLLLAARSARQKPARLPLLLAQAAPPPPQAASRGPRRQLSLQVRARISSGHASPATAPSDEERALRLELRQMRDELRPTRLVKRMCAGDDFISVGADGRASLVRLALAADRDELVVTRAGGGLFATTSLPLDALRRVSYGFGALDASKATFHADFVEAPWRCFALCTAADEPADVYLGDTDEQAVAWVLGLSALLHALGRLDRPLSPSALLWLRARMKLRLLAANERRSAPAQLARVVRQASASRLREG